MEEQSNFSEPTQARLEDRDRTGVARIPVFSPIQVSVGTFLGGPLAGIYALHANFKALGKSDEARNTILLGALFTLGLLILLPFLPHRFPNYVIPIAYTLAARGIADGFQMKKEAIAVSDQYGFESNWKVVAISIVGLLLFLCFVVAAVFGIAWIK